MVTNKAFSFLNINMLLIFSGKKGMMASNPVATSIKQNHKLSEALGEKKVDQKMYQWLVGRLVYLAHTRPTIAYSVSVISQFMHDSREIHIQAAY